MYFEIELNMKLTPEQKRYKKELFKLAKKKKTKPQDIQNILYESGLPINIRNQLSENLFLNSIKSTNNYTLLKWLNDNHVNDDTEKYTREKNLRYGMKLLLEMCPKDDIKDIFYWLIGLCKTIHLPKYIKNDIDPIELQLLHYMENYVRNDKKKEVFLSYLNKNYNLKYKDVHGNNLLHLLLGKRIYLNSCLTIDKLALFLSKYIDINEPNKSGDTFSHLIFQKSINKTISIYTLNSVFANNKIEIKKNNQGDTQLDLFIRQILNGYYENHNYCPSQFKNKMKKLLELLNYDFKIDQHKFLDRFSNIRTDYKKPKNRKNAHIQKGCPSPSSLRLRCDE